MQTRIVDFQKPILAFEDQPEFAMSVFQNTPGNNQQQGNKPQPAQQDQSRQKEQSNSPEEQKKKSEQEQAQQ